jgi:hypothetical protein
MLNPTNRSAQLFYFILPAAMMRMAITFHRVTIPSILRCHNIIATGGNFDPQQSAKPDGDNGICNSSVCRQPRNLTPTSEIGPR